MGEGGRGDEQHESFSIHAAILYTLEHAVGIAYYRVPGVKYDKAILHEETAQYGLLLTPDAELVTELRNTSDVELPALLAASESMRTAAAKNFSLDPTTIPVLYAQQIPTPLLYARALQATLQFIPRLNQSPAENLREGMRDFVLELCEQQSQPNYLLLEMKNEAFRFKPRLFRGFGSFVYQYEEQSFQGAGEKPANLVANLPAFERFVQNAFIDRYLAAAEKDDIVEMNQVRYDLTRIAAESPFHQALLELEESLARYVPGTSEHFLGAVKKHFATFRSRAKFVDENAHIFGD